jgi:hypothetical protein
MTSRKLQTSESTRSARAADSPRTTDARAEDFWKREAAEAKSAEAKVGAKFYQKGFKVLPKSKLEYFGNGFFKIRVEGEKPKLIRSDKDLLAVASIMRWCLFNSSPARTRLLSPFPCACFFLPAICPILAVSLRP